MLLLKEDLVKEDIFNPMAQARRMRQKEEHNCIQFQNFPVGSWKCFSDHNSIKYIKAKLENFQFREKDISKLMKSMLIDNEKIVPLLGLKGIGKSSLARQALHYAADRKFFTGGVMFISLNDIRTNFSMLKNIMEKVIRHLDLDEKQRQDLHDKTFSHEGMIEYLINFFNQR